MDLFPNSYDLSSAEGKAWRMVTLIVGPERRTFQIHIQRLGPLAAQLQIPSSNVVEMPRWDPNIFNLIMNWTYGMHLPRIKKSTVSTCRHKLPFPVPLPRATKFSPELVVLDSGELDYMWSILSFPMYEKFSADELRLHFLNNAATAQLEHSDEEEDVKEETEKEAEENAREKAEGDAKEDVEEETENKVNEEAEEDAKKKVEEEVEAGGPMPPTPHISYAVPDSEVVKADNGQHLLLKLMVFAESHKWEALFNDAVDVFLYGEVQLGRVCVPFSYATISSQGMTPIVQRLILNYVLVLGTKYRSMAMYHYMLLDYPDMLALMLERMDAEKPNHPLQYHGPNALTRDGVPIGGRYHIHNGELVINCKCYAIGDFFPGTRSKVLPFPTPP